MKIKKLLLAVAVVGLFALYSFGIRHEQPQLHLSPIANTHNKTAGQGPPPSNSGYTPPTSVGSNQTSSQYKDGTYQGSTEDAYYGNVQVSVTVSGGKIMDVKFLQYPDTHSTSVYINQQAMPYLKQEAIQAQNARVNVISGATFTSQAFIQSLSTALAKAQA